jgi:hypothetical protein
MEGSNDAHGLRKKRFLNTTCGFVKRVTDKP